MDKKTKVLESLASVSSPLHGGAEAILLSLADQARESLKDAGEEMRAGIYRHFKGGLYQALGIAAHCDTDERLVVYVSLDRRPGPRLRVRPLSSWNELVKWPGGETKARFSYQSYEMRQCPEMHPGLKVDRQCEHHEGHSGEHRSLLVMWDA